MIKTIVIPHNNNLRVSIPDNYVGKEIEVSLCFRKEWVVKKTMADYTGILSESDYQSLKTHTDEARKEWNRDI